MGAASIDTRTELGPTAGSSNSPHLRTVRGKMYLRDMSHQIRMGVPARRMKVGQNSQTLG